MLNRKNATLSAEVVSYNKKKEVVTVSLKRLDNSEFIEEMVMTVNTFKTMFPDIQETWIIQINPEILPEKYSIKFKENSPSIELVYKLSNGESIPYNEIQNLTRIIVNQIKDKIIPLQKFAETKSSMEVLYSEGNLFTAIEII